MYKEEGELDGVAKMYSFEDVHFEGDVDDTIRGRRDLDAEGMAADLRKDLSESNIPESDDYFDEFYNRTPGFSQASREVIRTWLDPFEPDEEQVPVLPRVHCRLLLETFAIPLTYFKSLEEVVETFIDAVAGISANPLFESGFGHSYCYSCVQVIDV